jgi:hypothetical protein
MGAPRGIDYDWAVAHDGILNGKQQLALFRPVLRTVAQYPGQRIRILRKRRGSGSFDLDSWIPPDSRLARDAEQEACEVLSPHVLAHSYRTYLFGRVLADLDGEKVDDELAYVSSLLHDLNLEHPTPGRCFAVVGAERARRFALKRGVEPERARRLAAEVANHLTPGVADDISSEGGFVSAGALLDVAGVRLDELAPTFVDAVLRQHPRHQLKRHLLAAFKAERRAAKGGRIDWLGRYAIFGLLVRLAPFPE